MGTIETRQRRHDALAVRFAILDRQRAVLGALREGYEAYGLRDDLAANFLALAVQVAEQVLLNCQAIWELSGPSEEGVR